MRRTLKMAFMTLLSLLVLDGLVAATLTWADRNGRLGSLVYFFEYGRSVPGKLARWEENPNLVTFQEEPADIGPVIRSYGMSFTLNIRNEALALRPDLIWEPHAGPAGPPNFTYALFEDDRANRREGDIAIFGVLSSVVPTMAAMSNQTRIFEQPAPLTYPIYLPNEEGGLERVDPLVTSAAQHRALGQDPEARLAWHAQLGEEDAYYSPIGFGLTWLDMSPLSRLVRRALAQSHVLLVQTNRRFDVDILEIAKPMLDAENIPYVATAEIFDPADLSGYLADGHFKPEIDRLFAERLIDMLGL